MKAIVFDWKRTLYNPDEKSLIEGASGLLEAIKGFEIPLILVGKGEQAEMSAEVGRLGVGAYFRYIDFREGEKGKEQYLQFLSAQDAKDSVFIGDRVRSELAVGNALGATTIWVCQGKFAAERPEDATQEPTYTVKSLSEASELLTKLYLSDSTLVREDT